MKATPRPFRNSWWICCSVLRSTKYKGEVTPLSDEDSWSSNNLEFPDYWEAAHSVLELASRWQLVKEARVVAA